MTCPKVRCCQPMDPDPRRDRDSRTGLRHWRCSRCGHVGMSAEEGLQLLFSNQNEYVLSYGPSVAYLKTLLSTVATNLFKTQGVSPSELAKYVAEWALLMGQTCGTVRLTGNLLSLDSFQYCRRQALKNPHAMQL